MKEKKKENREKKDQTSLFPNEKERRDVTYIISGRIYSARKFVQPKEQRQRKEKEKRKKKIKKKKKEKKGRNR